MIAPASNQRWPADGLEVGCWNGEVVRVAPAIDTGGRKVMAWLSSTGGVSGKMVRDVMPTCVEQRFGTCRAPHPVPWLADSESAYTARETRDSPQRSTWSLALPGAKPGRQRHQRGGCETPKRDHASFQPLSDALTVLDRLPGWIEDYNGNQPQSGLRMRSPREFIRG